MLKPFDDRGKPNPWLFVLYGILIVAVLLVAVINSLYESPMALVWWIIFGVLFFAFGMGILSFPMARRQRE